MSTTDWSHGEAFRSVGKPGDTRESREVTCKSDGQGSHSACQVCGEPAASSAHRPAHGGLSGTSKPDLDSVGLGWALRVCIINQLPGDTAALVLGSHFE